MHKPDDSLSVLFNEPKLLKSQVWGLQAPRYAPFSALQRAEIAEMTVNVDALLADWAFSALQRAEIAEIGSRSVMDLCPAAFQCSSTSRNC